MKKVTTALLGAMLLLPPLAAYAQEANQQLPNNGFEENWGDCTPWTAGDNKKTNGTTPLPWCISQVIGMGGAGATITGEKVEGYNSTDEKPTSAVKVYNSPNSILASQTVPGYVTLGKTWSTAKGFNAANKDGGTFGGIDFTSRPAAIEFMYKVSRAEESTEKAAVIAYLWKGTWTQANVPGEISFSTPKNVNMEDRDRNILQQYYKDNHDGLDLMENTQGGEITPTTDAELIAVAEISFEGNTDEWTLCHIDFNYLTESTPEKFNVIFSAGDYFNSNNLQQGNSLTIDDVKLIYYPYTDNHNGYLNVRMTGEQLTDNQSSTISIVNKSYTSCDFILPDFSLSMGEDLLPLGDIVVPDVAITTSNGVRNYNGTVNDLQLLGGKIVADVTVTGTIDADNFANMKIDVMWTNADEPMPIDVTFTTNPLPAAPVIHINGMEVNDGENFTVNAGDEVKFPVVEGIDIWYLLEENSAAPEIAYAPSKVVPDNYVKYDGNALAIEPGKTYRLTYIAKDTKTGLESNVKTVTFSTTTGITAIGTENGTAEYFNLQGVRVAEPTTGIYIRVANGNATKVAVK